MKNIIKTYALMFVVIISSCEEEIPWEVESLPEMLVVEGGLSNEFTKHKLKLSSSANYFYNNTTPKISGATINITGGSEEISFTEVEGDPGTYETMDSVSGIENVEYTLNITLNEPLNGTTNYISKGEIIKGIDLDSLDANMFENPIFFPGSGNDSLLTLCVAFGQEPVDIENFYQVNLYHQGVLLNDTIDEVSLTTDAQGMNGQYVHSMYFFQQFEEYDTLKLEIISVEKSYRDFVIGVQNIANQSLDPFDMSGPPANAIGNVNGIGGEEAIGYFKFSYVSSAESVVTFPQYDLEIN